jgi:hypothetical protein
LVLGAAAGGEASLSELCGDREDEVERLFKLMSVSIMARSRFLPFVEVESTMVYYCINEIKVFRLGGYGR